MLQRDACISVKEIDKSDIPFDNIISTIGHQDIADLLSVDVNRIDTRLEETDILYVAQYCGKRLPEGCTRIPQGSIIKFYEVTLKY